MRDQGKAMDAYKRRDEISERIDAHQHYWDINRFRYDWMGSGDPVLRHNYLPAELQPQMQLAGIDGAVLVQADGSVAEAFWLLKLADLYPTIRGVVGWVDLEALSLPVDLEALTANPLFKGIRPYFERVKDMQALQPVLARLDRYGLSCDLLAGPEFLIDNLWMAQDYANITFIFDHLAEAFRTVGGISAWKALLKPAAALPNVAMKISGYLTAAPLKPLAAETLRPYLETALELFGAGRLMFGSDWPVCTQAGSYLETVEVLKATSIHLSPSEQANLWGGSAVRAYKL